MAAGNRRSTFHSRGTLAPSVKQENTRCENQVRPVRVASFIPSAFGHPPFRHLAPMLTLLSATELWREQNYPD